YDSYHRNIGNLAAGNAYDPSAPPNAQNYNWGATNLDRSWLIGVGTDWLPRERLKITGSAIWQWTHGTADFQVQTTTPAVPVVPISNFDNTRKFTLNLKSTYAVTPRWDVTAGYAYERLRFSDIALDGYQYTIGTGTGASYLSGAYANPNYTANIGYMMVTLKF
ncbi:MAG TPA: MtrB/PioB family outer membrane beta-barrel protein, partial [Chloroflexota bacterium]|nr:MtrB/PioB family outer membrane beta-barrel protein [Chloroflexota bacterium]